MKDLPVCPLCGSSNTTKVKNFYHCNDCLSDFGRQPKADDGTPMVEAVKGLRFKYGDISTGSIRERFNEDGGVCLYEITDTNGGNLSKVNGVLTPEEWKCLKAKLVEELFLGDWSRNYIPINDGRAVQGNNAWSLDVVVSDDETYSFSGIDAFPIYWDEFYQIVDSFAAKLGEL